MTIEELQQQIDKERAELDAFVAQCNKEIGFRQGRLALLRELLAKRAADASPAPHP